MERIGIAAALALVLAACGAAEPAWPGGALVSARREALAGLLGQLGELGETRLALRARALARGLPECERLEAHVPEGGWLEALEALECAGAGGALARLEEWRGPRGVAFAVSLAGGGHLLGSLDGNRAGDVVVEISMPAAAASGAARLLLPGDAPGPGVLAADQALVHARLRPHGGLDVASLVPDDGQGADLFRLKSRLFSGAVLDGSWELAIYMIREGRRMPDVALALGFRHRAPARAAMETFVEELRTRWPVHPTPFRLAGSEGACVLDLGLLPELAPCYVATETALVVGWNPDSLRRALEGAGGRGPEAALVVDLERLPEADARLATRPGPESWRWPWRTLRADGAREGDALRLRATLEGGA